MLNWMVKWKIVFGHTSDGFHDGSLLRKDSKHLSAEENN